MTDIHVILGAPKAEEIKPLIKTEGIIIGVDRGALLALEEKLKVDVALGDFDSISSHEKKLVEQSKAKVINFPTDKDDTDAELAFEYILNHFDANNIYVYNWYGGRVDHLYSIMMIVLQKRFKPLISKIKFISKNNVIEYFLPGEYRIDKIDKMEYLSYILMSKVKALTLRDVKYELTRKDFDQPLALISNEFLDNQATLIFEKGIIAAIQSRDYKE